MISYPRCSLIIFFIGISLQDEEREPLNKVIADIRKQVVDIFFEDHPLRQSDPRSGLLKTWCIPCKFVTLMLRTAQHNVPGFQQTVLGLCNLLLGAEKYCGDQIPFLLLGIDFVNNTEGCQRYYLCTKFNGGEETEKLRLK